MKKQFFLPLFMACLVSYAGDVHAQNIALGTYKNIYDMLLTVPGLEVKTGSKGGSVTVRGVSSLMAQRQPLFVVDGSIYSGDIMNINPQDVQNITVLKDAASATAYGSQGAAGVILITMKKGATASAAPGTATHEESAYTYFISHKTKLKVFGLDDNIIIEGVIQRQQNDSLIFIKKRKDFPVAISSIRRVEMLPQDN